MSLKYVFNAHAQMEDGEMRIIEGIRSTILNTVHNCLPKLQVEKVWKKETSFKNDYNDVYTCSSTTTCDGVCLNTK